MRLWCAATDYSGDIGDRRRRSSRASSTATAASATRCASCSPTRSDFDAAQRRGAAGARCSRSTAGRWRARRSCRPRCSAHYEVYEFHPVVAKLQVFCSEDLGAFYLDVLKDRLYTTAPRVARAPLRRRPRCGTSRTRCCAGWRRSSASPPRRPGRCSRPAVGVDLHRDLLRRFDCGRRGAAREVGSASARSATPCNKEIEALRAAGKVGSSLQAEVRIARRRRPTTRCCASLGDDLKFVTITSKPRRPTAPTRCGVDGRRRRRDQVRALLALARRRRPRRRAPDALRPLHQQPVRRRRTAHGWPEWHRRAAPTGASAAGPGWARAARDRARPGHEDADRRRSSQLGDSRTVTRFFNLVRVHNTGAAFSFLAGASGWQRWFFVGLGIAASGFIVWMLRATRRRRCSAWPSR